MLHLKSRWGKTLGLTAQFDSHVDRASRDASALVGDDEVVSAKAVYKLDDSESTDDPIRDETSSAEEIPDSDDFDNLSAHEELPNEDDPTIIAVSDILQMDRDDPDDTSSTEYSEECMTLAWTPTVSAGEVKQYLVS